MIFKNKLQDFVSVTIVKKKRCDWEYVFKEVWFKQYQILERGIMRVCC